MFFYSGLFQTYILATVVTRYGKNFAFCSLNEKLDVFNVFLAEVQKVFLTEVLSKLVKKNIFSLRSVICDNYYVCILKIYMSRERSKLIAIVNV